MCARDQIFFKYILQFFFFFNDTATTEIYTLSLHDALPISFAVDLVHESGNKEFHLLPPTLPHRRPAKGGPGSTIEFPPERWCSPMGRDGISWANVGGQHLFASPLVKRRASQMFDLEQLHAHHVVFGGGLWRLARNRVLILF